RLKFPAIATCELIENVVQTFGTIGLAALGCGPWSLAAGLLIRGIVGLICVWTASPWRPVGRVKFEIAGKLVQFGLPFQLNGLIPGLASGWIPILVSRFLGPVAFGLVGWSIQISSIPMMLGTVLNRVAFPAYSRLQEDRQLLGGYVTTSVRRMNAALWIAAALMVILCPLLIPLVFGIRWAPAVPLVQWFTIETVPLILTGLLASSQNAAGRAKERLIVTVIVGLARWGAGIAIVRHLESAGIHKDGGLVLIGIANVIVSSVDLFVTASLVTRQNPHTSRLVPEIVASWIRMGGTLVLAIWAGHIVGQQNKWFEPLSTLGIMLVLNAIWEAAPRGKYLTVELSRLASSLGTMRTDTEG
ncbi:MAG: oligosaccharide flippase family protein, partial [Capsulimonadaceae bacterium]